MGQTIKSKWDLFHWFIATLREHPAEDSHLVCIPSLLMTDLWGAQSLVLIAFFPHAENRTRSALKKSTGEHMSSPTAACGDSKIVTKRHVQFLRALSDSLPESSHTCIVVEHLQRKLQHVLFPFYWLWTLMCICILNMFSLNKCQLCFWNISWINSTNQCSPKLPLSISKV